MHKHNVASVLHLTYTRGMSAALGGYIKTLRVHKGLTKAGLLRQFKDQFGKALDRSTLYRAEDGKAWPEGDNLTALMDLLGGRLEDLIKLRRDEKAPEIYGIELAEQWLKERGAPADVATIVGARSRADADEIANELEELAKRIRAGRDE